MDSPDPLQISDGDHGTKLIIKTAMHVEHILIALKELREQCGVDHTLLIRMDQANISQAEQWEAIKLRLGSRASSEGLQRAFEAIATLTDLVKENTKSIQENHKTIWKYVALATSAVVGAVAVVTKIGNTMGWW